MSTIIQGSSIGIAEEIRSFIRSIGQVAGSLPAAVRCANEIERLSRLSDAQLAARGLRRDEIASKVFQTYFPG